MNMVANIQPTNAEEALIEWLKAADSEAAKAALKVVGETGLPTRRVESWHYTDLRAMLQELPEKAEEGEFDTSHEKLVDAERLVFVNGKRHEDSFSGNDKIAVEFAEASPSVARVDDAVCALASLAPNVTRITIEGNDTLTKPLALVQQNNSSGFCAIRHEVTVRQGAEAFVIDRNVSRNSDSPVNAAQVDLTLEKDATANWFIVQQESTKATRLARMNIKLAEDAKLNLFILNAGGKLVRQEVFVDVAGENAHLALKGVNLVGEGAHIDVTTVLGHHVPHTSAEELFRNVVTGKGKGVFQGRINVAQIAQKTDAQMACNTLLLTDDSDFSAKPELEIFADDVICAHGATVTDISPDHLFYLRARGIDEKTARTMLIKAFVDEVVEELEYGALEESGLDEALVAIIDDWLDRNI